MFNVVIPDQIPKVWDDIKFATMKTGNITEEDLPAYLHGLLHDLLSGKAQCIVGRNEDRKLSSITILRVVYDTITNEKTIFIECLYSFEHTSIDTWRDGMRLVTKFAKKHNCNRVIGRSANPRAVDVAKELGFKNFYQYFTKGV